MHKKNENLNLFIEKIATKKIILLSLVSFIFVMILVNVVFKQNFNYLTQTFNYTSEYAYQLLKTIGNTGRNIHLLVLLPDLIMTLLYTVLLIGANYALYRTLVKNCTAISIITFSTLILSATQIIEILLWTVILLQYPNQLFTLVEFTNIITMMKTILTVIFFSVPLIGLCLLGIRRR